jgi:dipeptidyl aminopeptidase/acylaminoacyl peptidase
VGAAYVDDRVIYDCVEPAMNTHLQELNEAFGQECNIKVYDLSADGVVMIALVDGPRHPGVFVAFDRNKGAVGILGELQPALTPERLAATTTLDIRSRDGSVFRAYLTKPAGKGPHPMVVLPHGGPEQRDRVRFDVLAQALAAQGWMVLQPNFRGSGGYGLKFAEAGHRAWNGKIMEDIEDATDQVLAGGGADAKRVAIMGASFGGYAALMSSIRRPDLYCGVVSIAGVTDLVRQMRTELKSGLNSASYQYWLARVGDLKTDQPAMVAGSPARRAAEIKAPVLLLHGKLDDVVLVEQSDAMSAALKRARKTHQYMKLDYMNHTGWLTAGEGQYVTAVTDFLKDCFAKVA